MKKFILSAIVTVFVVASSFAAETSKINSQALSAFKAQFKGAEAVEWTTTAAYLKAAFVYNNKKMEAFYDIAGNTIATSSTISIDDLPTNAKRSFAKKYADYTVKEAIRFEATDETAYYVSANNETNSVIIKVSESGALSIYKNSKK